METEEKKLLCWGYLWLAGEFSPKQCSNNFAQIVGISVWPGCRLHSESLIPEAMWGQAFPCLFSKQEAVKNILKSSCLVFSVWFSWRTQIRKVLSSITFKISFSRKLWPYFNVVFEHMHLRMGTNLILHQKLISSVRIAPCLIRSL